MVRKIKVAARWVVGLAAIAWLFVLAVAFTGGQIGVVLLGAACLGGWLWWNSRQRSGD